MSNQKRLNRNYRGLAITAGVIGALAGAVGLTSNESVKAENPRVSSAATNVLSNTNAANFAAEIVAPPTDYLFTSASVQVNYTVATPYNGGDPSQILVRHGTITANPTTYSGLAFTNTVENAIATTINNARNTNRYGDIIGIVNAYNPPDKSSTEYARISAAITNILSNTNSQNFAAEIGGEPFTYFSQGSAQARYRNPAALLWINYFTDTSQVILDEGRFAAIPATYTGTFITNTVERAIATAIDTAAGANRYGDVIGITNVYKGPGTQPIKNSRASVAITNILSNTNALSSAGELVAPEGYLIDNVEMYHGIWDAAGSGNYTDPSQLLNDYAYIYVDWNTSSAGYFSDSVEKAIARAITSANTASRYGDVIGIVNAYKGPWRSGYANSRFSLAATSILSNLNSQNFAGEIVAPKDDVFFDFGEVIIISYTNSPSATDQVVVSVAEVSGYSYNVPTAPLPNTVEKATADAINAAETAGRIGDVIGITRAWNPQSLD